MKMEDSVPKRRHIKFRCRGITQEKTYNIQNRRKFEIKKACPTFNMNSLYAGLATFQIISSDKIDALSWNYDNFSSNTVFKFFKTVRTTLYFLFC